MGKQVTLTDRITGEIIYPVTTLNSVYNQYNTTLSDLLDQINTEIQDRYTKLDIDTLLKGQFTDLSNTSDNKISITVGSVSKTLEVAYAANASTLSNFITSNANNPVDASSINVNGLYYTPHNGTISLFGQDDGAIYAQASNGQQGHEIYGDYRSGQIAIRGKNNNTWQAWRVVLDSDNYANYAATKDYVTTAVNGIQIGGRNLIRNSDFSHGAAYVSSNGYSSFTQLTTGLSNGFTSGGEFVIPGRSKGFFYRIDRMGIGFSVFENGVTYTISCYAKASIECNMNYGMERVNQQTVNLTTSWQRFSLQAVGNGANHSIVFYPLAACTLYITGIQVEEGNKATAWTPAPEDVDASISSAITTAETDAASKYLKLTGGTITGNLTVNSGVITGSLKGNADSATKLQTARTIWGQSFDGSGNISGDLVIGNTIIHASGSNGGINSIQPANDYIIGDCNMGGTMGLKSLTTASAGISFYGKDSANYGTLTASGSGLTWSGTISATTFQGNADTATNIYNSGTVKLATATEYNDIFISQPSYSFDKPVKLLNFNWYNNRWALGNIRSSSTPSNGLGIFYGASGVDQSAFTEIGRFTINGWSGNAATATRLGNFYSSRPTSANITTTGSGGVISFKATSTMTTGKPADDGHILHFYWDNTGGWDNQMAILSDGLSTVQVRCQKAGTWQSWKTLAFTDSIPTKLSQLTNDIHAPIDGVSYGTLKIYPSAQITSADYDDGAITPKGVNKYVSAYALPLHGTADYANGAAKLNIPITTSIDNSDNSFYACYAQGSNSVTTKPSGVDAFGLIGLRVAASRYGQIMMAVDNGMFYRQYNSSSWLNWKRLIDENNYTNYNPLINGSHATSSTSIYAPTSQLSVQSATNSYLIGSTSTTSLNTVYSNSSIYMNGSNLYADTFIGNLTGTASQATNSYNSGIKWANTVTVGSWSSICLLPASYGAYILTITFSQNSEASCNTYLVNTGYACAQIVQLNSTDFGVNYSQQIRVTQNGSSWTQNFIEVLEPFGYNGATTLNIRCALNRVDNSTIIGVTTYTAYTATAGGTVWDTITSSKNKMVANLAGTADIATLANTITANSSTTTQAYLLGVTASGTTPIYDPGIYITSTSGTLHATYMTATTFTGNLTGTASNATLASTISSNLNTNTKGYLLAQTASGTTPFYDSGIYIGTTPGNLIATTFTGNLVGNASTSNAATGLANIRQLWGQGFDGTGDVSGNISNTGNIIPSASNTYTIGVGANYYSAMYATTFYGALSGTASYATYAGYVTNSISFKNTSNTTVTYNGESALDLTGGVYYAATAGNSDKLGGFTEASFLRERGNWADGTNALAGLSVTSWSSKVNYQTDYGNSLHIQGNNTWYNRLDFGTSGRIYFYQAINPSSTTGCMQYKGTLAFLTDIPTLSLTTSGTGNAVSSISVSGHTITQNLTTYNNYSLPTAADSTLGGVKTGYTTSGKNYKVSIDASGNLYTYVPWSDTWNANSVNVAGYVSAPTSSNANKVWKTDANGNPGWRTDQDTTSFTLSMAVSSGTSSITLAFGTKYLLTAGGSTYIFTMPDNTNYQTGMYVGAPQTDSNSAVTNPYVNIYDTAIYRSKLQLVGAGGTKITSNDSSVITISSDSAGKIWVANSGITTKYTSGLYINQVAHGTTGCFTEVNNANIVLTVESESDGKFNKQLGFSSNGNLYYRSFVDADPDSTTAWKTIIDSGNIGSQAVTSASKLTTAVSIWGKTFDGSSNITGNLVSTGLSTYWDDTWSDGTNSHPWYGYDMNHANTGVYSTTISDYCGMTLKTANTEMSLAFTGGVSINTALTITSGGLNLYKDPLRFQNTLGTTLGIIGMDPGVLNIWGPLASNATTSTGIVLIGKQGGWRCIQIDSSNNTYIGATRSNMTASGYRLYVDGTQYISSTLTTGGNITAPAFYESSDYRLKNSIYTISNADVKLVDKIKLKEYRFNNDPSKKHYGVVAQDLLDLGMNDLVKGDEKSYYSVDYISLLILKMQAMQNKIDELTKKINNL